MARYIQLKIVDTIYLLLVFFPLIATNVYAIDFYGANVIDMDVPSSYMRMGLIGFRPVVDNVSFDSPAAKQGFQRGDIILSINGKDIKQSSELNQVTADMLSVYIFRSNERITLSINRTIVAPGKPKIRAAEIQTNVQISSASRTPALEDNTHTVRPLDKKKNVNMSLDQTRLKHTSPQKKSSEPVIQNDFAAHKPLVQVKQTQVNHERDAKLPKTDCVEGSGKCNQAGTSNTPYASLVKSDIFGRKIKPAQDRIVFANTKGDVVFSHTAHLESLNKGQCMLCHKTENPTPESIQSRLDDHRAAHAFCRGCHQKTGKGPSTDCHTCHKSKNS